MSRLPSASIIVNNYNYGRFLRGAIDSALAQTYPNKEVLLEETATAEFAWW